MAAEVIVQPATLAALVLSWIALAAPALAADDRRPLDVQAHRGGEWGEPESSLAAFRQAIAHGVPTIELDLQATPAGDLLVSHDPDVPPGAPRFDAVLDELSRAPYPVRVSAEIKRQREVRGLDTRALAKLVVGALRDHSMLRRAIVQSFDANVLGAVRDLAPDLPTSMLVRDAADAEGALRISRATIVSPRVDRVSRDDVRRWNAEGLAVIPWVVDDPSRARELVAWGVAGLVTNRPDRLMSALGIAPAQVSGETMNATRPIVAAALASTLLLAPPQAEAARRHASGIGGLQTVAVFPFTSGGNVDTFCTSLFVQEARKEEVFRQVIDPYELSITTADGQPFQPQAVLPQLLEEARGKGADAVLLGEGKWYDWGFRMEFRLIDVEDGSVAWQGAYASGFAWTGPSAKKSLARRAVHEIQRAQGGD